MSARLDEIPTELVEKIVRLLHVADIGRLRLTCRSLQSKSSGPHFKTFFFSRRTDLSLHNLQALADLANHEDFGPAVRNVVVVATAYVRSKLERILELGTKDNINDHDPELYGDLEMCTEEELAQTLLELKLLSGREDEQVRLNVAQVDVQILTKAMCKIGKLHSLSIEATVYEDLQDARAPHEVEGDWKPIWAAASRTYDVVLTAMATSRIAVDRLDVYSKVWRCSVPTYDIGQSLPRLKTSGLRDSLAHLRVLSLSMSSGSDRPWATYAENFSGPAGLLALTPELEELDLHLYNAGHMGSIYDVVFDQRWADIPLPRLRKCTLRGIRIREDSLRQLLLSYATLEELELQSVHLTKGAWRPIFDLCSSDALRLQRLTFDRLTTRLSRHFQPPGWPPLVLDREQICKGFDFRFPTERTKLFPCALQMRLDLRREYGPPAYGPL
ncbi:hypothetical protein MMC20_006226 [Loxospora ochrophaea]|nr:hypothetical protein [Loxospora ochrophaea]